VIVSTEEFVDALDEVAWFMDEPTATSSAIPMYYLTKEIKKEVKVVLTGQGADEPLAGYQRYYGERLYRGGFKYLGWIGNFMDLFPRNEKLKRAFRCFSIKDDFERILNYYYLFTPSQKRMLLKDGIINNLNEGLVFRLFKEYGPNDSLGRMLFMDTRSWLPDDLLMYGDKSTMINSIEARVPFLDKDLIKFVEKVPSHFKLSLTMQGKYLHKTACQKWLPESVIKRKKVGFATPIDQWFRGQMGGYVRDQLLDGKICKELFNVDYVGKMLHEHIAGRSDYQRQLFSLLMLERWCQKFSVVI
jgi:asparagine synthase (glutamine-hydrolysing)